MTSSISFGLVLVCTAFVGIVQADVCSTTYGALVTECNDFGRQLYAQINQSGTAGATDLQPGRLCTDPCFTDNLTEVKGAMTAGCFGEIAATFSHGNATMERGITEKIDAFFDAVRDALCAKNGAQYCITLYQATATMVNDGSSSSSLCSSISSMGCCLKNAIDLDARIRELNPSMPTGIQIMGGAANCNVTIPTDVCPDSGHANFGTGGLSAACEANPVVQTCGDFGEALYQQYVRHKTYGTTMTDLSPDTLCADPCFTHQNLQHVKDGLRNGCFGQALAAGGGVPGVSPSELRRDIDAVFDAIENFACVKNGAGEYCLQYLENGMHDTSAAQMCPLVQSAGCCTATIYAQDSAIRVLRPSFPNRTDLARGVALVCPQVHTMTGPACPGPDLDASNPGSSGGSGGSGGSGDGGLSGGDDAGIVIGVLAFIGIAALVGVYVVKPRCDDNKDADDIQYESSSEMGYTRMSDDA